MAGHRPWESCDNNLAKLWSGHQLAWPVANAQSAIHLEGSKLQLLEANVNTCHFAWLSTSLPNLQEIPLTFGHVISVLRNSNYSTLNYFKYEMRFWSLDIKWCVCVWLLCCAALWLACLFLQALSLSLSLRAASHSGLSHGNFILHFVLLFAFLSYIKRCFLVHVFW